MIFVLHFIFRNKLRKFEIMKMQKQCQNRGSDNLFGTSGSLQKNLPFILHTQGRNERGKGVQFPGRRITMGLPNHCGGR